MYASLCLSPSPLHLPSTSFPPPLSLSLLSPSQCTCASLYFHVVLLTVLFSLLQGSKGGEKTKQTYSDCTSYLYICMQLCQYFVLLTVPFRDSVLTKLLQNALGGNSKTVMVSLLNLLCFVRICSLCFLLTCLIYQHVLLCHLCNSGWFVVSALGLVSVVSVLQRPNVWKFIITFLTKQC